MLGLSELGLQTHRADFCSVHPHAPSYQSHIPLVLIFSCLLQQISLCFDWHVVLVVLIAVGSSLLTRLDISWEVAEDMRFEQVLRVTLNGSVGQLLHALNYLRLVGILLLDAACWSTWFDL